VPVAPLAAATLPDLAALEAEALANRPEAADASLRERLSKAEVDVARAAFQPQVVAQAGWEANGGTWGTRAGSWVVGAGVRVNLFRGFADRARLAEAHSATERRALEREQVASSIRLEVRSAAAALDAARARETLAERVVAHAEEGQRIVRDRYEQGLADSTALTKAAEHVVQATQQQVHARVDVQLASANLERALGR
jgi:outer membrane protein